MTKDTKKQELTEERVREIVREEIQRAWADQASVKFEMELGEEGARRLLKSNYLSPSDRVHF